MPRYESRVQFALAAVVGLLLLANLFTLTLVALTPQERGVRAPVLLSVFLVTLLISVPAVMFVPRWLLRPYRELVGEAERAPVAASRREEARDETEFVLETFQAVVAELRAQKKELERLSARASERAASAEMFSERIVASLPSGLVAFDSRGRATVVNAPARLLLPEGARAEGVEAALLLHHAPDLARMVEDCLRTGRLYRREEVSAVDGDGRARKLGVTVAPIEPRGALARADGQQRSEILAATHQSAAQPRARGALCLLTDITEVAELREAVALKRNLESLGEMSAGLAHEFKNALATLHGYAQLLERVAADERTRAGAAALLAEVRGLTQLVTSFLNFARPRALELSEVSLGETVADCATELKNLYDERGVALSIEGDFGAASADERMLRQSLLNLLRNAAEAFGEISPPRAEDSPPRRVVLRGSRERDAAGRAWHVVEIEDTAGGIAAEDLPRIFIPFFTTKHAGHGVGLALAHRVATEHGGTLAAANAARGAIFTLRLPA